MLHGHRPAIDSARRRGGASALIAAALLGLGPTAASADSRHVTTSAGKETYILGYTAVDNLCSFVAVPEMKVTEQPANGTLVSRSATVKYTSRVPVRMKCNGNSYPGIVVYYQPREGFTGTDHFKYEVNASGWRGPLADEATVDVVPAAASAPASPAPSTPAK